MWRSSYLIVNGRIAGTWRRTLGRDRVVIDLAPYRPLADGEWRAINLAAERLGRFMGMPVTSSRPLKQPSE